MLQLIPPDLTVLDRVALSWFLLAWLGYGLAIHAIPWGSSITAHMNDVRRTWMRTMLGRDNRITDASLIGHTVHSATFFASTTMVALAALLGMLGAFDRSFAALDALAFTAKTSRMLAEAKLLLLVLVFAHTFLKLSWALRQLNYCLALLGAAPLKPDASARDRIAEPIAAVLSLAIRSFNAGIRGYLFALAVLAWLLGPEAFLLATTGMVSMLLWRQFGSATAVAIRHSHAALGSTVTAAATGISQANTYVATGVHGQGRTLATRMQP
jgi:uncharacterized membrane protein